jgi:flagellar biosynthesis/type III secretory pathway chaperone
MISAQRICEVDCQAAPLEFNRQIEPQPEAEGRELSMIENLGKLIDALREELKNYGEMLALLDRQQEYLLTRAANEVSHSISLVKAQGAAILEARQRREKCRRAVATAAAQAEAASFADLIPLVPVDYQPLLTALVDENNELLSRVRRRARQNHLMLKRSVELMQQVLNSLCPSIRMPVFNGRGKRAARQPHEEVN